MGFPHSSVGKESTCNPGYPSLIPGSGRSPGERIGYPLEYSWAFPCGSAGKEYACNEGDLGSIPGLGRFPWSRERLPTPVFGLEISMDCIVLLLLSHFSRVRLYVTPWTVAHQTLLSMGILRTRIMEWAAISFSRGIFLTQGSNTHLFCLLHCQAGKPGKRRLGSP